MFFFLSACLLDPFDVPFKFPSYLVTPVVFHNLHFHTWVVPFELVQKETQEKGVNCVGVIASSCVRVSMYRLEKKNYPYAGEKASVKNYDLITLVGIHRGLEVICFNMIARLNFIAFAVNFIKASLFILVSRQG